MAKIKPGTIVRAHLDAAYKGEVLEVLQEQSREFTAHGPTSYETFCIVRLLDGRIVKSKITDLYIDY